MGSAPVKLSKRLTVASRKGLRIPPEVGGIQLNFCKSSRCANFNVPPFPTLRHRKHGAPHIPGDYKLASSAVKVPKLECALCGEQSPLRSNLAAAEELDRQARYLLPDPKKDPSCGNPACAMFSVPLSKAGQTYVSFGKTPAGTLRYRCNICRGTFTGKTRAGIRQRKPHINADIFTLTVNKVPISRILETTGVGFGTFYGKLDHIYSQCLAFAGHREHRMLGQVALPKMYLSTDRQSYVVNWTGRADRRTVQMTGIGTADLGSGYVFGMTLNFDERMDEAATEADARAIGDLSVSAPYRKYARLWLKQDYAEAVVNAKARDSAEKTVKARIDPEDIDPLLKLVGLSYADAFSRDDIESSDFKNEDVKLPKFGMLVHQQYTMYSHFLLLAQLMKSAEKVRLFLDQDSGIRAAAVNAFGQRIKEHTADAFYVKVAKDANAYQKQNAVKSAKAARQHIMALEGLPNERAAALIMMKREIKRAVSITKWDDRWALHPWPIAAEPAKYVCWLTENDDYDEDHVARLYLKATLHPIDRFFMQTRRRVSLAERSVVSVRSQRRMWSGYAAYSPAVLQRYLEICRTYYNYCLPGKDGKTPAMRLGLAKAPQKPRAILSFT
jgi:transposase-like protein